MKRIAILTGAGMSVESGMSTFRDADGLWENHNVMDVASIEGWYRNPELIINFYNDRRRQLKSIEPNLGHLLLKKLEKNFEVSITTQNVDNLHERAGSSHIIHLHGILTEVKSSENDALVYEIDKDISMGDLAEDRSQLRPNIVWFGEAVPMFEKAIKDFEKADIVLVIGTSLQVYPAASLVNYAKKNTPIYLIDPNEVDFQSSRALIHIKKGASEGIQIFMDKITTSLE